MCLIVNKKYEDNDTTREAYKVCVRDKQTGFVFTLYQQVLIDGDTLVAEGRPDFCFKKETQILEGGAIHCFPNIQSVKYFFSWLKWNFYLYDFQELVIYKVTGKNIVAEGTFEIMDNRYPSVCFKSIKLEEEINVLDS